MAKTWVVVAESSRAKIFELEKRNSPLKEIQGFAHTSSRLHPKKLSADLTGRTPGQYKPSLPTATKAIASNEFAKNIGKHLDAARCKGKFSKLIIMSPPAFLGRLRKQLGSGMHKCVISEVDKNLVRHSIDDIQAHLPYGFSR
jgi:protein required for attachment to host cells